MSNNREEDTLLGYLSEEAIQRRLIRLNRLTVDARREEECAASFRRRLAQEELTPDVCCFMERMIRTYLRMRREVLKVRYREAQALGLEERFPLEDA